MAAGTGSRDVPLEASSEGDGTAAVADSAAEDQATASARHAARCARRFWSAIRTCEHGDPDNGDLPDDLARWAFESWWRMFMADEYEVDDDDDDE